MGASGNKGDFQPTFVRKAMVADIATSSGTFAATGEKVTIPAGKKYFVIAHGSMNNTIDACAQVQLRVDGKQIEAFADDTAFCIFHFGETTAEEDAELHFRSCTGAGTATLYGTTSGRERTAVEVMYW